MIFERDLLLEVYNPGAPVLAPHTAAFAAQLAAATPAAASAAIPELTIEPLRASVAESLASKSLAYPQGYSSDSYTKEIIGGMDCYILRASHSDSVPTLVMFYGGGFCLDTLLAHKSFMANTAALNPCNIIFPDFPLAPETKAPVILAKVNKFLKTLLADPSSFNVSEKIILSGWSSGGHMALTATMNLQKEAPNLFNKISQLLLLSSWMDLSLSVARLGPYQAQQHSDTIAVGPDVLEPMANWYLPNGYKGDEPEYCPALRPLNELKALPPTTVVVGGCEVLLGDSIFLVEALKRAGAPVQLVVLEGQTHNYVVFDELSRDGVFVPELIGRVVRGQSINEMNGKDGFGVITKTYNREEKLETRHSLVQDTGSSPSVGNHPSVLFSLPLGNNADTHKEKTLETILAKSLSSPRK